MDRCKAWIKACGRKGFVPASITRNTYVCSKHFHDGKPTPAFPDPNPASTCNVESQVRPKAKRKAPTARSIDLPTKTRKIPELDIGTNTDSCMEASGSASGFAEPTEKVKNCGSQTNSEKIDLIEKYLLVDIKEQKVLKRWILKHDILSNDSASKYYTGLSVTKLHLVFHLIYEESKKLKYWRGETELCGSTLSVLLSWEAYLLTLMRLRRGFDIQHLGMLFGISPTTASRIITTWIHFLAQQLNFLVAWPTQEQLQNRSIDAFKYFPNTIAVIDCTEFFIQKPSSTSTQRKTRSNYKHHNTLKLLVACTPADTITFLSELFTGNISDKQIVNKSGFLNRIQPGDNVMADRGFLIRDVLMLRGATLTIPPFAHGKQFSMHATTMTRRIAKARIIVERAIGRMMEFQILSEPIAINMLPSFDAVVKVCSCLCNMQPFLSAN